MKVSGRGLALAVGAAALVAVVVAGAALVDLAPVATGVVARTVCEHVHVRGLSTSDARDALPTDLLVRRTTVTLDEDVVEAALLGRWTTRVAVAGDGGCRLLSPDDPLPAADVPPMEPTADDLVVPTAPTIAAANAGLDTVALTRALDRAFAVPADLEPGQQVRTSAVVVVHRGTVVAERYAQGVDPDTPLPGSSLGASMAESLAGRLAMAGRVTLDSPVVGLWPDTDPRAAITWDHLLTMTDGLAFDDGRRLGSDRSRVLFTDVDPTRVAAGLPQVAEPGTRWAPSTGSTTILCGRLATVATLGGGEAPALVLRNELFEPLAMTSATVGSTGDTPLCASSVHATARDWARFGLLYEQDGAWGPRQLLPEGWVREVTTAPVRVPTLDPGTGDPTPFGRHWWLNVGPDGRRLASVPADAFWAAGDDGQFVAVVPSRDLVVVRLGLDAGIEPSTRLLEPVVAAAVAAVDRTGGG